MNRLFDLRFVIGAFFTVVGLLLVIYGFLPHADGSLQGVNRICGGLFMLFGVIMLLLSFAQPLNHKKDKQSIK